MNLAAIMLALAAFMLSVWPPALGDRSSWLSFGLLLGAALWAKPRSKRSLNVVLALSLALPILLNASVGNWGSLGALPYALSTLLFFTVAQDALADEFGKAIWILALAAALWLQLLFASTQWRLQIPDTVNTAVGGRILQNRLWGCFVTPNILGGWLILCLPILAGACFEEGSKRKRAFLGLTCLAGLGLLLATKSAGAWASLSLALFVGLGLMRGRRKLLVTLALASGFVLVWQLWSRGFTVLDRHSYQDMIYSRLDLWRPAFYAWLAAPWFGYGQNLAEQAYRQAQAAHGGFGFYPHQAILSVLLNWGLAGLLCAAAAFALLWTRLRQRLETTLNPMDLGILVGVLAALIHAQVEMSFQQPVIFLSFLIALGVLLAPQQKDRALAEVAPRLKSESPILWKFAFIMWVLLCYHGGLMDWQWILVALFFLASFKCFFVLELSHLNPLDEVDGLSLLFLCSLLPSIVWSVNPQLSLAQGSGLACLWILWKCLRQVRPKSVLSGLDAWVWVVLLGCLAVFGMSLWLAQVEPEARSGLVFLAQPHRAVRPIFPNQNLFAAGLVGTVFFATALNLWRGKKKLLHAGSCGIFILMLVYSGSKSALLVLAGAGAWIFLRTSIRWSWRERRKLLWGTAGGLLLLLGLVLFSPLSGLAARVRQQRNAVTADANVYFRSELWRQAASLASERPLTGWGLGTLQEDFYRKDIPTPFLARFPLVHYRLDPQHAHDEWLELAVEAGFLPVLILALLVLRLAWRWTKDEATIENLSLEAGLMVMLIQASVDFNFHCPTLLFGSALLLALRQPSQAKVAVESKPQQAWVALLLASLFLASVLGFYALRTANRQPSAQAHESAVALAPLSSDAKIDYAQYLLSSPIQTQTQASRILFLALDALNLAPQRASVHLCYALTLRELGMQIHEPALLTWMGYLLPNWERLSAEQPQASPSEKFRMLYQAEAIQALSLRPYDARWRLLLARLAAGEGNTLLAQQRLTEAIALEPNYAGAWELRAHLAQSQGKQGEFKNALLQLQRIEALAYEVQDQHSLQIRAADWGWIHQQLSKVHHP